MIFLYFIILFAAVPIIALEITGEIIRWIGDQLS